MLLLLCIDRAVEKVLDVNGRTVNSYKYDAFGKLMEQSEEMHSLFKYSGQLGVVHEEELQDVYSMRARHYDAQHGRFTSMDPSGENMEGRVGGNTTMQCMVTIIGASEQESQWRETCSNVAVIMT